jgi:xanthine dehydrogenase molybdopterin-binding subunit B
VVEKLKVVGKSTPRVDAFERVTGKAKYTGDIKLPGMLYARVLRSPHPHARIRSLDVSRALDTPGVEAVLTHENTSVVWTTGDSRNKRYLFNNPVRFVGDAVAAVAASDRHLALGGVAPIPWPLPKVERFLSGKKLTPELAAEAGKLAVEGAQPLSKNAYKVGLTETLVRRTILSLAG